MELAIKSFESVVGCVALFCRECCGIYSRCTRASPQDQLPMQAPMRQIVKNSETVKFNILLYCKKI